MDALVFETRRIQSYPRHPRIVEHELEVTGGHSVDSASQLGLARSALGAQARLPRGLTEAPAACGELLLQTYSLLDP